MPLMREWIEITVDEDLLIPVVRELLDMATNPNHVEVIHGEKGQVILAEAHLAEHWYQERLKRENDIEVHIDDDFEVVVASEIVPTEEVATSNNPTAVVPQVVAQATTPVRAPVEIVAQAKIEDFVPLPVKRGPGRPRKEVPPSASPDGEDS